MCLLILEREGGERERGSLVGSLTGDQTRDLSENRTMLQPAKAILTVFKWTVQLGIKYIQTVVQPSPPPISRTFLQTWDCTPIKHYPPIPFSL